MQLLSFVGEPIDSVKIRVSSATAYSGQTIFVGLFYHKGNDVKYKWDLGDGTTKDRDDSKVFGYQYKSAGIYLLKVFGYNMASNATSAIYIVVQDVITGLSLVGGIDPMVPNTTFTIKWNIIKGMKHEQ